MITQLLQVKAFMRKFGQPMHGQPVTEIHRDLANLGYKLIREELREMEDSITEQDSVMVKVDKVEMLDALCDLLYVVFGQSHRMGLALILPVAFRRVHESNMTKLWTNEEVQALQRKPKVDQVRYTWKPVEEEGDRRWLVVNEHGKAVKSPSYEPANLAGLLDELDGQELLSFTHAAEIVYSDSDEPDSEDDGRDGYIFA